MKETIKALWDGLHTTVMPVPNEQTWRDKAVEFGRRWNFPNCCGAMDGKHIMIKAPANAGSLFYNYKGRHSIVLMAIVDANYCFVLVDIGAYGRSGDGGVSANCAFGKGFQSGALKLPEPQALPNVGDMPHVLVADEAFPLRSYIMRPYPEET